MSDGNVPKGTGKAIICPVCGDKIQPEKEEENMSKQAVPVSLESSDIDFINRVGVGKNFSAKARDVLRRAESTIENIVTYEGTVLKHKQPGAILAYEANEEGEKSWGTLPFPYAKKSGYAGLPAAARAAEMVCQIVTVPEVGFVAVWIAHVAGKKDCEKCLEKIKEVLGV